MPKVAGKKNHQHMQDVLGTKGAYGKQIKNQGMRVKRKGKIAYQNKSTFAALNRRSKENQQTKELKEVVVEIEDITNIRINIKYPV